MQATNTLRRDNQPVSVGKILRNWRMARGVSQFDLASRSGYSPRHLSFIETGRTKPSREALVAIAESLEIPLRERNSILQAAGFAQMYTHTPLEADEMAHIRGVLEFILKKHKPYATVVQDRYANCLMGNEGFDQLMAILLDPIQQALPINLLRTTFHPRGARRWIVNWEEVACHLLQRAECEFSLLNDDHEGAELLRELRAYAGKTLHLHDCPIRATDPLLPIHIRKGDLELRLIGTVMTLGRPQDVTLQELVIKTFFPADEASERAWTRIVANNLPAHPGGLLTSTSPHARMVRPD